MFVRTSFIKRRYWLALLVAGLVAFGGGWAHAEGPFVAIYDMGKALSGDALKQIATLKKMEAAAGQSLPDNAALLNDRLALMVKKDALEAELWSGQSGTWQVRATLAPLGLTDAKVARVAVGAAGDDAASIDIEFVAGAKKAVIRCELKPGQVYLRTTPTSSDAAAGIVARAASRFAVVPDFYGDDLTMDAQTVPVDQITFPTDDVFLQPAVGGSALLGYFWSGAQDVEVGVTGRETARQFTSVAINYSGAKPFAVLAVLDAGRPCFAEDYTRLTHGDYKYEFEQWNAQTKKMDKIPASVPMVELPWGQPYFAQWRVDFLVHKDARDNDIRTRQMLLPEKGNSWRFAKLEQGLDHRQNEQVIVRGLPGKYPAWFAADAAKTARLAPPPENYAVVIYPYDRGRETPLDAITFMDLFRDIIGKGPCEYILTASQNTDEGLAACPATSKIASLEGKIKQNRAEVENLLNRIDKFLHACHNRLTTYQRCKEEAQTLLQAYAKRNPDNKTSVNKLREIINRIPQPAKPLAELEAEWKPVFADFRATLDTDDQAAKTKRNQLAEKLREFGGKSEGMLMSGARKYLKQLRTQAGVEGALHPDFRETAAKIRDLVTESLKGPTAHEMMNQDLR